jgi:nucleoside-diphosphate-sugar epimerase
MDTALVIAAGSAVGRHLCNWLRAAGVHFHGTSRTPVPGLLDCDLIQPGQVEQILESVRPRWIFQCAGATADSTPENLYRLHEGATQHLLEVVHRYIPTAVVLLFGSAAEYGNVPPDLLPVREDAPTEPHSHYGRSKLAMFRVAARLARTHGLRVHFARPFNLLGPGLRSHYFAAALTTRLRQRQLAKQPGLVPIRNGQATRDWVDVRDVADAVCRLALFAPPCPGEVGLCNIATGQETSVLTLATHLCQLAGDFQAIDEGEARSRTEIARSCGDSSRLRTWTGWQPRFRWQDSLLTMWVGHG